MLANPVASLRRSIRRGSARLLILSVLSARPMHGYEIAREISAMFEGTYEPSPGVIYPTLQSLEDQGYISGTRVDEKITYKITNTGRGFLEKNKENLDQITRFIQRRFTGDEFPILKSAMHLQKTITIYLPEMSKEKRKQVAKVLEDATNRITRLMAN